MNQHVIFRSKEFTLPIALKILLANGGESLPQTKRFFSFERFDSKIAFHRGQLAVSGFEIFALRQAGVRFKESSRSLEDAQGSCRPVVYADEISSWKPQRNQIFFFLKSKRIFRCPEEKPTLLVEHLHPDTDFYLTTQMTAFLARKTFLFNIPLIPRF